MLHHHAEGDGTIMVIRVMWDHKDAWTTRAKWDPGSGSDWIKGCMIVRLPRKTGKTRSSGHRRPVQWIPCVMEIVGDMGTQAIQGPKGEHATKEHTGPTMLQGQKGHKDHTGQDQSNEGLRVQWALDTWLKTNQAQRVTMEYKDSKKQEMKTCRFRVLGTMYFFITLLSVMLITSTSMDRENKGPGGGGGTMQDVGADNLQTAITDLVELSPGDIADLRVLWSIKLLSS